MPIDGSKNSSTRSTLLLPLRSISSHLFHLRPKLPCSFIRSRPFRLMFDSGFDSSVRPSTPQQLPHRTRPIRLDVPTHIFIGTIRDSDSNSSTDSESNDAKIPAPENASKVKKIVSSEFQHDEKISGSPVDVNKSYSGLDQHEQTSLQKTISTEPDSPQDDGETAAGEGQVSPGKLYRAAVLKNRFAETILKAKEKTLSQADKSDPEKLRKEKE